MPRAKAADELHDGIEAGDVELLDQERADREKMAIVPSHPWPVIGDRGVKSCAVEMRPDGILVQELKQRKYVVRSENMP